MMQTVEDSDKRAFVSTVVILEDDLFIAPRLEDVVRAQGGQPVTVETPEAFVEAVDCYFPVLALVDLKTLGDWATAIQRSKMRPHTRAVPIYAFGSHVEVELLKQARQAGADHAWARGRMMEEVVNVVGRHLDPPRRQLEGTEDSLSRYAVAGLLEFNHGEFFEQHEYLELAWMEEKRPIRDLYQGILQIGVAFLQIQRNNWPGAIKMFRRGLPRLRDLPSICQGVAVETFYQQAACIHAEISQGGPSAIESFDNERFPQIQFVNPYKASTPAELGVLLPVEK